MEDHSIVASRKWKNLTKEQRRIYYEIYEIAVNKYTVDNNVDGYPFFALQYDPNIVKKETELNYPKLKEIYDMLIKKKDWISSQDEIPVEEIPTKQNNDFSVNSPYYCSHKK
ncbi:hypothetical protein Glove_692g18 [Diversispora epigaea]|uniref:Uncharacterized protein n=1 Tax=Diversispora epigaea TaxID=1348612 RepID=A0A397G6S3_9GLOM|nr:hypothetical protein Glove_692g18 [Diversispora epigaea]